MANNPKVNLALVDELPGSIVRGTIYMSPDTSGNFIKVGVDNETVVTIFDGNNYMGEQEELAISAALNDLNDRIDDSPWESGEGEKSAQLKGTGGAVGEGAVVHAYGSVEDRTVRPLWYIRYAYADSQDPGAYNCYDINYSNVPDFNGLDNETFYALIYDGSTYTVTSKNWSQLCLDNPLPISNGDCNIQVQVIYPAPGLSEASGEYSHAEGYVTNAIGDYSHAEGNSALEYSHAPGDILSVSENSWMFYDIDPEKYNYYLRFSNSDYYYDKTAIDALFEDMCISIFEDWDNGNAVSLNLYSKPACGNEDFICDIFAYNEVMSYTFNDGEGGYSRGLLFYYDGTISDSLPVYSDILKIGASGKYSHTEGVDTLTFGEGAHAEGYSTTANGNYSHAEGANTVANSYNSHAEGEGSHAEGDGSHAEGYDTSAYGAYSHTEGYYTNTMSNYSHAEGYYTTASGEYSHAEGYNSYAGGRGSHAEGYDTSAFGTCSHAEGNNTFSLGEYSHAEGFARERNYNIKFIDASYVDSYWDGISNYDVLYIRSTNIPNTGSLLQYGNSFIKAQYKYRYGKTYLAIPRHIVPYTASNARLYIIGGTYGAYAHAEGLYTTADGSASHAEGYNTIAGGYVSHAEGDTTMSQGDYSHTEGKYNIAKGVGSHAEGHPDSSTKDVSMYMAYRTRYIDSSVCYVSDNSVAYTFYQRNPVGTMLTDGSTDYYIIAASDYSSKYNTLLTDIPLPDVGVAYDSSKYILRYYNLAKGLGSHAEGNNTKAFGNHSHTEGINARAWGKGSHAEGYQTEALSFCNMRISGNRDASQYVVSDTSALRSGMFIVCNGEHALIKKVDSSIRITLDRTLKKDAALDASGFLIVTCGALGEGSHTEGYTTTASGIYSHAEGINTTASGSNSHAEGYYTTASGSNSHAEGYYTTASGQGSHAEGYYATASGQGSHAEGYTTTASGHASHAEGRGSSKGQYSHAEGEGTASGQASHAEGTGTATGNYSHAEGERTDASGLFSHAEGSGMTKYYYFSLYTSIADSSVNQNFTLTASEWTPFKLGDIVSIDPTTDTSVGTVIAVTEHSFRLDKRITPFFNTSRYLPFYIRNLDGYDASSGKAFGNASHTEGIGTQTFNLGEHANGYYNKSNTDIFLPDDTSTCTLFTIGCGGIIETDSSHWFERKNAVEVLRNGDVYITGVGGYDGTNPGYENSSTLQEVIGAGGGGGSSVYTLERDTSVMTHCVYKQGGVSTLVYEAVVPVHTGSYYELYDTSNTRSGAYFSPYTSPSDKHFEISATGDDTYFGGSKLILSASIIGWNFTSPVTMLYDASITGYKAYTSIPFEYFNSANTIEGILVRYTEAIMM